MPVLQNLSGKRAPTLRLLLPALALTACEVVPPPSQPNSNPISSNQVYITPGGVCSLSGLNIGLTGNVPGPQNLVDGQCLQPWTNLRYQAPVANSNSAQCRVAFQTGFSYHYVYQQPETNVSFYTSTQSYDVPQTAITYYTSAQTYDSPQTRISYYTAHQEYDAPYTSVSYYVSTQSYDTPTTNVTYYTQESAAQMNLAGDFSAQGCAAFVAGKLPSGALSDPHHLPLCSAGPLQHHAGACSVSDATKLNCTASFALASLASPLPGNFSVNGCAAFTAGQLPANAVLNDPAHPVTCAAAVPAHRTGACSAADPSVLNCQTVYAQSSLAPTSGSYLLSGTCDLYAAGKLPANAITGDALHPVTCSAAPSVHHVGACDPADPAVMNCATTYASHTLTVNGSATAQGCDAFAGPHLPAGALTADPGHALACAATSRHVTGACDPADTSITNCVTTYSQQSLANASGDFTAAGCPAFAAGVLPANALLHDPAHPLSCTAAPIATRSADGDLTFAAIQAQLPALSPAANTACGAELTAYLSGTKGLPAPVSCTITALQQGGATLNNTTCAAANPSALCAASNGAKKNCTGTDVAAAPAYATDFTVSKVKGTVTCDTPCADTLFCATLPGTVGDNYHNCSAAPAATTVDHDFTAAADDDTRICSSGQTRLVSKGPYGVSSAGALTSNLPDNACIQTTVCLNDTAWKKLTPVKAIPSIDLVILFDVTSSMTPQIQAMVANLQNLVRNLNALTPSLRLGLASYRDFADAGGQAGDQPFLLNVPLTSDIAQVSLGLNALTASGGGDLPESLSTALRAAVTGNAFPPYFGPSTMGWESDPSRVKVVLAISDAADKKSGLPSGAATLDEVAALLKSKGILFLGIGYQDRIEPYAGANDSRSFKDFSYLAQNSGAIIAAPGIDLDGDGLTTGYGELPPGAPAVLLMTEDGQLEGAPANADPTRVLADAITQMVITTRPFQFNLAVTGNGRTFTPATNTLSIPSEATGQYCFSQVSFAPRNAAAACGVNTPISLAVNEASTGTDVNNSDFVAAVNVNGNCYVPPTTPNPPPPPVNPGATWSVTGFDGTTTPTSASLIWQVTGTASLTTATVNVGTRPDQLNVQSVTANATLGSQLVTVTGLNPATTYYFQVTVRDNSGTVVSSGVIAKTTKP